MLLTLINTEMMRGTKSLFCCADFYFILFYYFYHVGFLTCCLAFPISKKKRKTSSHILENVNIEQNCWLAQILESFKTLYCAFLVASHSTAYKYLRLHSTVEGNGQSLFLLDAIRRYQRN